MAFTLITPSSSSFASTTTPSWTEEASIVDSASRRVDSGWSRAEPGIAMSSVTVPSPLRSSTSTQPSGRRRASVTRAQPAPSGSRARAAASDSPMVTVGGMSSSKVTDPGQRQAFQSAVGADEALDELGGGCGEEPIGRVVLGQHATDLEDRDPVGHLDRLVHVVGDEHDRLPEARLEAEELVLEPLATDGVHGAEWLVHEQDGRIGGHGPRHAHALALPAGQGRWVTVPVGRRVEAHQLEQLLDALGDPGRRPAEQARHDGHVVADGQVREQPDLLDDVADPPPQLDRGQGGHVLAVDGDPAARRLDQAVDHLHRRRLAAAGRPDQDADLARPRSRATGPSRQEVRRRSAS